MLRTLKSGDQGTRHDLICRLEEALCNLMRGENIEIPLADEIALKTLIPPEKGETDTSDKFSDLVGPDDFHYDPPVDVNMGSKLHSPFNDIDTSVPMGDVLFVESPSSANSPVIPLFSVVSPRLLSLESPTPARSHDIPSLPTESKDLLSQGSLDSTRSPAALFGDCFFEKTCTLEKEQGVSVEMGAVGRTESVHGREDTGDDTTQCMHDRLQALEKEMNSLKWSVLLHKEHIAFLWRMHAQHMHYT